MYDTSTFLQSEMDYRTSRIKTGTTASRRRAHGFLSRVRRAGHANGSH